MILADTTFLVDILRKKLKIDSLNEYQGEILSISEISVFELFYGLYSNNTISSSSELMNKRIKLVEKLISKFQVLPFGRRESVQSAKILGELKLKGLTIDIRDGLIAGIAKANGIDKILTRDIDHFSRITGVTVISY